MKKIVLALAIITFIGLSAGVIDGNGSPYEPREGEMGITSTGSSASATTAVGPNGTKYESEVSMTGSTCMEAQTSNITDIDYSSGNVSKVSFQGVLQTPNPCYIIDQETKEVSRNGYRINVTAEQTDEAGPCVQCIGAISYNASFETDKPFKLEIVHENESVKVLEHPEYDENGSDKVEEPEKLSFTSKVMNWFRSLF